MRTQQQDALDLALQHQALSGRRADLSPADAYRMDRLHAEQRHEQQLLQADQWQRALERRRSVLSDGLRLP